jgi:spermidine/putrescine transport system substrate-binding protein
VLAASGGGVLAAGLAACGTPPAPTSRPTAASTTDTSDTDPRLRWQSWPEYLDNEGGPGSTLARFEKQTGIDVNYTQDIEGNETFTDTVQQQLVRQQSTGYDLIVLSDDTVGQWIAKGWVLPLDKENIPNWTNIRPQLLDAPYDQGAMYSLPWMSGFAGLGINKKLYKELTGKTEIRTLDDLWDPRLKGRVTVLDDLQDTMGLILMAQGKNIADFTDLDFNVALAELQEKVDSGQVRQVTGNGYLADLESGAVAASTAWSGDLDGNDELAWFLPESGGTYWTDAMLIPALAARKKNAERAMNFYYDPKNAAALLEGGVRYATPVPKAREILADAGSDLVDNPLVFPTEQFLSNTQVFKVLTPDQNDKYSNAFNDVIGA